MSDSKAHAAGASHAERDADVVPSEEALRYAIEHIRNGAGVLDTNAGTRKYAGEVHNLADRLETKRGPLIKKILQWHQEAQRGFRA